jgi:Ca2+-binding EF-hand superfamily protein
MNKVFKSFDKDNSGFIDINELKDVSVELGRPLDAAELEECMKDLDQNKDGKISYDEFANWWLSGR